MIEDAQGRQWNQLLLVLESQTVELPKLVLGTELRYSSSAVDALNCQVISPASLWVVFKFVFLSLYLSIRHCTSKVRSNG
jgi:hypothetical protein